jgi:hypothetical protein
MPENSQKRSRSITGIKLPFALWTRKAIQSVIYQMWRVLIAIRTIGEYLKRWGFTPQKPMKRACERSPKAVKKWLDETYPKIKARAQKERAEIYWGGTRPGLEMISSIAVVMHQETRPR